MADDELESSFKREKISFSVPYVHVPELDGTRKRRWSDYYRGEYSHDRSNNASYNSIVSDSRASREFDKEQTKKEQRFRKIIGLDKRGKRPTYTVPSGGDREQQGTELRDLARRENRQELRRIRRENKVSVRHDQQAAIPDRIRCAQAVIDLVELLLSSKLELRFLKPCCVALLRNCPFPTRSARINQKLHLLGARVRLLSRYSNHEYPLKIDPGSEAATKVLEARVYENTKLANNREGLRYNGVIVQKCFQNYNKRARLFAQFSKTAARFVIDQMHGSWQEMVENYLSQLYWGLLQLNKILNKCYVAPQVFVGDEFVVSSDTEAALANYGSMSISPIMREIYAIIRRLKATTEAEEPAKHHSRPVEVHFLADDLELLNQ